MPTTSAASATIRLLVVDDHTLFRRGLIALLSLDDRFAIVGEAGDAGEALRLLDDLRPHLVLLDNHLPGVKGVDAIASFKRADPAVHIMMLTVSEDEDDLARALHNGADGYLLKTAESDQLCEAIVQVMDGQSIVSPQMMNKLVAALRAQGPAARTAPLPEPMSAALSGTAAGATAPAEPPAALVAVDAAIERLSPREREIFLLIARSLSNKQIARELDIAETTVKIHVQHIFKKLELSSRVQVAVYAAGRGLG